MKKQSPSSFGFVTALSLMLLAGGVRSLSAFQSTQVETVSMGVTMGGVAPAPEAGFQIKHTPIRGFSLITKLAIIQGAVGMDLSGFTNSGIARAKASNNQVRVKLQLRMNMETGPGPIEEKTSFFYTEPAQFSFQISPSSLTALGFQYRILAELLDENGVLLSTAAIPATAFSDLNVWVGPGSQSNAPVLIGPSGGRVTIFDANPNDGDSQVDVPSGVARTLTQISLNEIPVTDPLIPGMGGAQVPYAMYKLEADPPLSGNIRFSVIYPEFTPNASGWQLGGSPVPEKSLSLAIWDGFTWRNIGGKIDALTKTLSSRAGNFSYLGVFAMGPVSASTIAPAQKFITPNGDGDNETADFSGIDGSTRVEIFDVTGHRVRGFTPPMNGGWDGRNDSGSVVESGVYIYQFSSNGERVSGIIAVAK